MTDIENAERIKEQYAISEEEFKERSDLAIRTTILGKEPDSDEEKKLYVIARTTRSRKN